MITVIDYGVGNIGSVLNMIKKVGGQAIASSSLSDIERAEKLLLPGVGSFDNAIRRLSNLGLPEVLRKRVEDGATLLGICLGMQLLADSSEEGRLPGLGLVPGEVKRFDFGRENAHLKVPHMGWNYVRPVTPHILSRGLEDDARFYFVHSYFFQPEHPDNILFKTNYGNEFASGVKRGNVVGVQFHPEKSHRFGMQLLKNFIEL